MKKIEGGICAVPGIRAAGAREGKYGVAVIAGSGVASGVFTKNKVKAAPLDVTADHLMGGRLDGIIANSGCANAYTGARGIEDAKRMAELMASFLRTGETRIGVASTGVIGRRMDLPLIEKLFDQAKSRIRNSPDASKEAALAIMTTDTRIKESAVEHEGFRVGGIVKGAGMIAPDVATMLCFIYTDADLTRDDLKASLIEAADDSFNMLIVDGDMSTNDTVLATATGERKCSLRAFKEALKFVCMDLARQMARDGEGASKCFETVVTGALTIKDARKAAKAVAGSSLVKTAVYGADPNWGRIVAALGRSEADLDPNLLSLTIEGSGASVKIVEKGKMLDGVLDQAKKIMKGESMTFVIDLGMGDCSTRSFGCDLTEKYVDINAKYTT